MGDSQAKITLEVGGAAEATRAAQNVETAWSKAGRGVSSAWQTVGRTIAGTVAGAVQDIGRVALAAESIDFAGSIRSAIDLQGAIERMSLAAGRDAQTVKRQFTEIGNKIGEQPQHVAAWQRSLNRTVYDFDKTTKAADLLGRTAFEVGRSFDEMAGIGDVLGRSSKDADDFARSLGVVRAQAQLLGKDKGASLFDSAGAIAGGVAGKFAPGAVKSKGGLVGEATAIQTALIEQGLPPEQAAQAAATLMNDVAADPRGFERQSGLKRGSLTDQFGRITKSPIELLKLQQAAVAKMAPGDKAYQRQILTNVLGPLAGGAASGLDLKHVQDLANLSSAPPLLARPVEQTPTIDTEAKIQARKLEAAGTVLPQVQAARGFFADHPVAGAIGGAVMSGAGKTIGTLAAGGGAGTLAGSSAARTAVTGALVSPAVAVGSAAVGGLAAGVAIDDGNYLSDRIAIAASGGDWTSQGRYAQGIRNGEGAFVNQAQTDYVNSPEAQGIIAAQMETTRRRNVAGPIQDPTAFLFPQNAGQFGESGASAAGPSAATLEAAFSAALSNSNIKITVTDNTGAGIAVTDEKGNANVSQ